MANCLCQTSLGRLAPKATLKHADLAIFGKREAGGPWDITLPFRVSSSDGVCGIDIVIKAGIKDDIISGMEVAQAAAVIIERCIESSTNEGGVVGDLGLNKNLAVRIVSYKPDVQCADEPGRRAPPAGSCRGVLDYMPASYDHQVFGKRGSDNVEVNLPQSFLDSSRDCVISTGNGGPSTKASWYMLYLAATAVDAICVRQRMAGIAVRLGFEDPRSLFVTVRGENPPSLASDAIAIA